MYYTYKVVWVTFMQNPAPVKLPSKTEAERKGDGSAHTHRVITQILRIFGGWLRVKDDDEISGAELQAVQYQLLGPKM